MHQAHATDISDTADHPAPEQLYRSDTMRIIRYRHADPDAPLVVTFPDLDWPLGFDAPGWGQHFLGRRGADVIAVQIREPAWFQYDDFFDAMGAVRASIEPGRQLSTYGSSMGGYGAILAARALNAQRVVATCPQFSIDRNVAPFEKRYQDHAAVIGTYRHDVRAELSDDIRYYCLFDPTHFRDRRQAQLFGTPAGWQPVIIRGAGHGPLRAIIASGAQEALFGLITGRTSDRVLRAAFRRGRAQNVHYIKRMGNLIAPRPDKQRFARRMIRLASGQGMTKFADRWTGTLFSAARGSATLDPDHEAFVETSADLMCDPATTRFTNDEAAALYALRASSGMATLVRRNDGGRFQWDFDAGDRYVPLNGYIGAPKTRGALHSIDAFAPRFDYIADMQDRRARSVADPAVDGVFPVFSFNRIIGSGQRVLWPLHHYHDFGTRQFLDHIDPDAVPWSAKIPKVVWRGTSGGHARKEGVGQVGLRQKRIFRLYLSGEMSAEDAQAHLMNVPRYALLKTYGSSEIADMGFVAGAGETPEEFPFHEGLFKPRMTIEQQQGYRYIAVLRGRDVGSSLFWSLYSGSVAFVMDTPFETFATGHFRAWEHYIPFAEDGHDFADKFQWAEDNPEACQDMIARSRGICALLARPDLRQAALSRVIDRLNRALGG